jgi:hypothetical protein
VDGSLVVGDGFLQFLHLVDGFKASDDGQVGQQNLLGDTALIVLRGGAGTV